MIDTFSIQLEYNLQHYVKRKQNSCCCTAGPFTSSSHIFFQGLLLFFKISLWYFEEIVLKSAMVSSEYHFTLPMILSNFLLLKLYRKYIWKYSFLFAHWDIAWIFKVATFTLRFLYLIRTLAYAIQLWSYSINFHTAPEWKSEKSHHAKCNFT